MVGELRQIRAWLLAASVGLASACSSETHVVGEQCPSPYSGKATVRGSKGSAFFGTSCAPCTSLDQIKLDKRGCPIFVTFESCGGPVCLAGYQVSPPPENDGGAENDGGSDNDSGAGEDSGAH